MGNDAMVTLEPQDTMRAIMKVGEPFKRRALGAVLALPIFLVLYVVLPPPASEVMDDFYRGGYWKTGGRESRLGDPLKAHSQLIKSHVIKDVANKNMKYRIYGMEFLGHGKIREALPVLLAILHDETEESVYRGHALKNIFRIDMKQGLALAEEYRDEKDILGYLFQHNSHPYK